ncbi:S-phase kinase-associated protein 1-like [Teleopsis dalmanni]|uniref:S-phase kinase-associated protein 1-like n=1 Tax=Teleopsis dalmanni TaxID=139649 RepID=UPI0018CC983E|nr:S-phase kinase-associated protein 1-like [Teleopsis dalmanni]
MSIVRLKSCDGKICSIEIAAARRSETISNLLDAGKLHIGDTLTLPNTNARLLEKIITWINRYHKITYDKNSDQAWRQEYFHVNLNFLSSIRNVANSLKISDLIIEAENAINSLLTFLGK